MVPEAAVVSGRPLSDANTYLQLDGPVHTAGKGEVAARALFRRLVPDRRPNLGNDSPDRPGNGVDTDEDGGRVHDLRNGTDADQLRHLHVHGPPRLDVGSKGDL